MSVSANNLFDQEVSFYASGASYCFDGQNLKLIAEYSITDFDEEGTTLGVATEDFNTFIAQIQLQF